MIGTLLLNRYELLEKIGEGGMGVVYKAKCHLLNRFVAVKILKMEFSKDENFVARFKREASAVASVSHPNIVNVYDVGAENGINFIVMEYINGKTLHDIIKENVRLTDSKTIKISLQIAKALQCAHKQNIIHRDIKPDNIMITEDNIVKVMDFGIAKMSDSHTMTNSNKVLGSVHYFSPEQAKGLVVDCRTDIYSLGIVMYEMVTGEVPFEAESSISIALMHIQQPIVSPKKIICELPESINQVILKATEKEPINRYQSAYEMVQAIDGIKDEFHFKINLSNRSNSDAKFMDEDVFDSKQNFTKVMGDVDLNEKQKIKEDEKIQSGNKTLSKNKRAMIIIITIMVVIIIISVIGKYIYKGSITSTTKATNTANTTDAVTKNNDTKSIVPKVIEKSSSDTKKFVLSLLGSTEDIAEKTVVNNGFLIGNITDEYNDSIPKGVVISQSPDVNTFYDKGGKVDLVISKGKKIVRVTVPKLKDNIEKNVENFRKKIGKFR